MYKFNTAGGLIHVIVWLLLGNLIICYVFCSCG